GICPSLEGGVSPASPPAYSPRLGLFFTSTNNFCMDYEAARSTYLKGTPYISANIPYNGGPGGHLGALLAWDAGAAKKVWQIDEPFPSWSGVLATAGDVVFYGTLDGWFKSIDARTGKVLSKFKVGSGVVGNPITYRGPDGKQYVAVYAGIGGDWLPVCGGLPPGGPGGRPAPADHLQGTSRAPQSGRPHLDIRPMSSCPPSPRCIRTVLLTVLAALTLSACDHPDGPPPAAQGSKSAPPPPAFAYEAHVAAGGIAPPGGTLKN